MRKSLSMMLESDPLVKVVGTANNGQEGIDKIRQLRPDIVTMDVEMPVMDGLTALGIIMREMPLPVLMVSSVTTEGADATLTALGLGAVDFFPKTLSYVSLDMATVREELVSKVKSIVTSRSTQFRLRRLLASHRGTPPAPRLALKPSPRSVRRVSYKAVVVGVSTGGPFALLQIIPKLPADFPVGILVVQHMPPHFTKSMADRLNNLSQVRVREAQDGDPIEPATVLIAPGGSHMTFRKDGVVVRVRISAEPSTTLYRPCADIMIGSAVEAFDAPLLGVIMTGMGKDGLEGLIKVRGKEGYIIAQSEETCVVYGMPRAVVDAGIADSVVDLEDIPRCLVELAGR